MKTLRLFITTTLLFAGTTLMAQVQINKPIQLTGGSGERVITNLEAPVNGTDAVNKDYVDAAVAASGGGSTATMMSNESPTTYPYFQAVRYCGTLNESGHTDWYLPSVEDFEKLHLDNYTFPNATSTNYFFLSHPGAENQYPVVLTRLYDYASSRTAFSSSYFVRCVR